MFPDLNYFINYKNTKLYSRYERDYPFAKMKAEESLVELMKFIWLCRKHEADKKITPHNPSLDFTCVIHAEMSDIDNMWHTFLLFTKEYQAFCQDYLNGVFFHHEPSDEENQPAPETYELELSRYLSYIYDNLGEQTLITWFNSLEQEL